MAAVRHAGRVSRPTIPTRACAWDPVPRRLYRTAQRLTNTAAECLTKGGTGELRTEVKEVHSVDASLVRRTRAGDAAAFSELVRIHRKRAVSVAYRFLNNAEDATDVAQDAFVRAFENLEQLADDARFAPWLMRIVSNLALNFRRARKLRASSSLDDAVVVEESFVRPGTGERMEATGDGSLMPLPDELHEKVSRAMADLPEKQRMALVLFSVEGLPQKDVAEILECKVGLVKWHVFEARRKLKEALSAYL